jgi:hypothetical protein
VSLANTASARRGTDMTARWDPVFVLPNVDLVADIGCETTVLAPARDGRVSAIRRASPMFRRFLNRFSDNFGQKFEPAVLIIRSEHGPAERDVTRIASFRDLIAVSTTTNAWSSELRGRRGHRAMFGETFAIYPWMLDRHDEHMIGSTPAILGMHEVARFKGQSSPSVFRPKVGHDDVDQPLLAALMAAWVRRYDAPTPAWRDIALMRSLNMAYNASLLPAGTEATFYDVGRVVSLWVSAFEILVHPGGKGRAGPTQVFDLIESTPWLLAASRALDHETGGRTPIARTTASWIYQSLYRCRNEFLHGNPVERADIMLETPVRTVLEYAAPLYRLALTAFLPLTYDDAPPPAADVKGVAGYISGLMDFRAPQKAAEQALLTAIRPPVTTPLPRNRVTRPAP